MIAADYRLAATGALGLSGAGVAAAWDDELMPAISRGVGPSTKSKWSLRVRSQIFTILSHASVPPRIKGAGLPPKPGLVIIWGVLLQPCRIASVGGAWDGRQVLECGGVPPLLNSAGRGLERRRAV
jgi:hypothetical protein